MKILVADDERDIADAIGIILQYSGYESDIAYDGQRAYELTRQHSYDGMILDIMMPKMDGIQLLSKLREEGDVTPILLLTAKNQVEDRITGLNEGADDYIGKPFDKGELIARVNVMMNRKKLYDKYIDVLGNTTLNQREQKIQNGEISLRLSGKEMDLLKLLMKNSAKYVSEGVLIEKVWKEESCEDGSLQLYVSYLKNKLHAIKSNLMLEQNNEGYRILERAADT